MGGESKRVVGVLATLDTKGAEAAFLREQIEADGCEALLIDIGVIGEPGTIPDITASEIAAAGGSSLEELLANPTREAAAPIMVAGARKIVHELIASDDLHALIGMGGSQGSSHCSAVMQSLPYGFPKILVSTVASGDTSPFVGIKDITMMFSVGDILGLNPFLRRVFANAAAAACGMAQVATAIEATRGTKPVVGMTNLGVLTKGAEKAVEYLEDAGYEVIVFHAVGSGGRAMEQMMRDGLIGAVFDYGLGEIPDGLHGYLRACDDARLTVAAELGLPQVICPGGAEHYGVLVAPDAVPDEYKNHDYVFHSPVVFVPRLRAEEIRKVARDIGRRLAGVRGNACFMIPELGTSRYAIPGGPLHDPESDAAFFTELEAVLPNTIEIVRRPLGAEDPAFVREAVDRLIAMIEA